MGKIQKNQNRLTVKITRYVSLALIITLVIIGNLIFLTKGKYTINISPSLQKGIYSLSVAENLKKGDIVLLDIPENVKDLMLKRQYVYESMKLLKKIVATEGDTIQIQDNEIYINGQKRPYSKIKDRDKENKVLVSFLKDGKIPKDYFLVMGDTPDSYDSRYFGIIHKKLIKNKAKKL